MNRRTSFVLAALALIAGATPHPVLAGSCGHNPNVQVEIFAQQKPGALKAGTTKALKLRGQLYGDTNFRGDIILSPNGPLDPACPLFVNGDNKNLTILAGQPFVVTVTLKAPAQPATQSGNCALKYTATYTDKKPACEAGKGNQVDKPYQVRPNPPAPGEDFE